MTMKITAEFDPETLEFSITIEGFKAEDCYTVGNEATKSLVGLFYLYNKGQ